jgi:hypothetical protein
MQGTKKAQLAAALAATLGFALHGAATAADATTGTDTTKPTPIAAGKETTSTDTKKSKSTTSTKGKTSTCSTSKKGKSSACAAGKESGCSTKK